MTAALEGDKWSAARPGRTLPPGKTRYPFYRRLDGPQGRSRRAENLVPSGIRSRTVQPVVSRYTDWATRPTALLGAHHILHVSRIRVNISLFIFPSESPVRQPPPCSLTGFPWTGILRHQSHWSIYSTIHSFMCVWRSPQLINVRRNPPSFLAWLLRCDLGDNWSIYTQLRYIFIYYNTERSFWCIIFKSK